MKRTSVAVALGLALYATGCEKPAATPKAPSTDTNLGGAAPAESGSSTKKGTPVKPPATPPAPADKPAETAPPAPAATDAAAPAAEAPKKD